jgi:hypothetical protein
VSFREHPEGEIYSTTIARRMARDDVAAVSSATNRARQSGLVVKRPLSATWVASGQWTVELLIEPRRVVGRKGPG